LPRANPDVVLADLRERLARTRLPDEPPLSPWSTGTSVAYLKGLLDSWRDGLSLAHEIHVVLRLRLRRTRSEPREVDWTVKMRGS
jgi:hypothetical protein